MNRTLVYPASMPNFKPYSVTSAHAQSGDGTLFRAALGSLGDDKATFHVYVWTERPDGTLTAITIAEPPNNAPTFAVVGGKLLLYGVLESSPGVRILVERDVPGYVAPAVAAADPRLKGFLDGLAAALKAILGLK